MQTLINDHHNGDDGTSYPILGFPLMAFPTAVLQCGVSNSD